MDARIGTTVDGILHGILKRTVFASAIFKGMVAFRHLSCCWRQALAIMKRFFAPVKRPFQEVRTAKVCGHATDEPSAPSIVHPRSCVATTKEQRTSGDISLS